MINNGKGTTLLGPDSPDLRSDVGGDDDDDAGSLSLSQYSSCGESEFDRYCSANSAMGTSSFRSSSFGGSFHDDGLDGSFENFSLGGRVDRSVLEEQKRKLSNSGIGGMKVSVKVVDGTGESSGVYSELGGGRTNGIVGSREHDGWANGVDLDVGLGGVDGREEDGMELYRHEHSDDVGDEDEDEDDSMYGCDSDDENRTSLYVPRKEVKVERGNENESPLLMNSSVAFGSEDWDDFELGSGEGNFGFMTLGNFQEQKEEGLDSERILRGSASVSSTGVLPGVMQEAPDVKKVDQAMEGNLSCFGEAVPIGFQNSKVEQMEEVRDIPVASCQVQVSPELGTDDEGITITPLNMPSLSKPEQEDVRDISVACNEIKGANCKIENFKSCSLSGIIEMEQHPLVEKTLIRLRLKNMDCDHDGEHLSKTSEEIIRADDDKVVIYHTTGVSEVKADPLSGSTNQLRPHPTENKIEEVFEDRKKNSTKSLLEGKIDELFENQKKISTESVLENNLISGNTSDSLDLFEDHAEVVKADNFEPNEFYDEIVNEMEEILMDVGESPGARFSQGNRMVQLQPSLPLRDGGSTASTSGIDGSFSTIPQPLRIDGVEVVGAKQKKGGVSFGERLVGVKEYTVYVIRVWSGKDQWEIERRYRDFSTLYRRLKSLFSEQGWILPSPWSCVEKESRKMFRNASPGVVSERSALIQECLHSVIHSSFYSSPPSALIWFLVPQDSCPSSPALRTPVLWSIFSGGEDAENIPTLGKTISLIVEIRPHKFTKQMLEAQHYTCAGCHKHFDDGMTLIRDFVQTLGWGKPRLCEYTGQLFCSSCHTNDVAVLPARVLHCWDFTQYPVSQLAKSYLDSIYDQPMLCVSAVNPLLFSKVPALHHVMSIRKRIGTMLPYVRCPFRRTVNKGLGPRRYLLESNEFFALRDLIDLSKGPFSALPVMVETVARKILEHIVEQCLICCDVGIPCSARQACNDPSSLIFPFQEGEIERCPSCESVFHKACFRKVADCSCGKHLREEDTGHSNMLVRVASSALLGSISNSVASAGFLSGLFSKSKPETTRNQNEGDTVILMGSLPGNSL